MDNLHQMYQAITDDMEFFVELFKRMKDADMNPEHVVKLLSVAKNGLGSLHFEYNALKTEVEYQKVQKEGLSKALENIKENYEYYSSLCQKELAKMDQLSQQRDRQENLVKNLENNNEEYLKIQNFVEEKIVGILTTGKLLLEYAVTAVIESIRDEPEKYRVLIEYNSKFGDSYTYGQNHSKYYLEACKTVIMEESS